jgi:hypothetical protein
MDIIGIRAGAGVRSGMAAAWIVRTRWCGQIVRSRVAHGMRRAPGVTAGPPQRPGGLEAVALPHGASSRNPTCFGHARRGYLAHAKNAAACGSHAVPQEDSNGH